METKDGKFLKASCLFHVIFKRARKFSVSERILDSLFFVHFTINKIECLKHVIFDN